jgi:hypothetical protein
MVLPEHTGRVLTRAEQRHGFRLGTHDVLRGLSSVSPTDRSLPPSLGDYSGTT